MSGVALVGVLCLALVAHWLVSDISTTTVFDLRQGLERALAATVVRFAALVRLYRRRQDLREFVMLHRLRPYRFANRTARRDPRSDCMPIPRPPTL